MIKIGPFTITVVLIYIVNINKIWLYTSSAAFILSIWLKSDLSQLQLYLYILSIWLKSDLSQLQLYFYILSIWLKSDLIQVQLHLYCQYNENRIECMYSCIYIVNMIMCVLVENWIFIGLLQMCCLWEKVNIWMLQLVDLVKHSLVDSLNRTDNTMYFPHSYVLLIFVYAKLYSC